MNSGTPLAEIQIEENLVRNLLQAQYPEFAALTSHRLTRGGTTPSLGLERSLRCLPRRTVAAELIRHEQTWLPAVANRLAIPIPSPLCIGVTPLAEIQIEENLVRNLLQAQYPEFASLNVSPIDAVPALSSGRMLRGRGDERNAETLLENIAIRSDCYLKVETKIETAII